LNILNGKIRMEIPSNPVPAARIELDVQYPWNTYQATSRPPQPILQAMSKLSLYRLQEQAKLDLASGDTRKATLHLEYLATHLLSQGNRELATSVLLEADYIKRNHMYSKAGEKGIKYGTRSLFLLPSPEESRQ
jgi:Ca-activated chloride channel family protein